MAEPIITNLAIETWKEVFNVTKPQQKVFLNFIFLKLFWGKNMMLYNEKTKAEIENIYNLKKLEWDLELKKAEVVWDFEIQKIKQEQQILLEINKYEKESEAKNMAWVIQKSIWKIEENAQWNIDPDKFKRLKDLSKEFSSEDMQEIISWILAWEYNQSWSFSLKTMDIVRALSRDEINLFKKFCWLVVNWYFILSEITSKEWDEFRRQNWFDYLEILYLQELWLISFKESSLNLTTIWEWENKIWQTIFNLWNKNISLLYKTDQSVNIITITNSWRELMKLINFDVKDCYYNWVLDNLRKKWFEVSYFWEQAI